MPPPRGWPIRVHELYGCWEYTGRLDRDGYGRVGSQLAHRVFWTEQHGAIPEGLEIEHTCRNRRCLRHLELLTRSQQERAKAWHKRVQRTTCTHGHNMQLHGIITPHGGRVCRECNRL